MSTMTGRAAAAYGAARQTVSKEQLVVMLLEKMVRDLDDSMAAIEAGDVPLVHKKLMNAQEIINELDAALNVDLWPGGKDLKEVYSFILDQLVQANVTKTTEPVRAVRPLVVDILESFRAAYTEVAMGRASADTV